MSRFKVQNEGYANGVWGTETVIKNQGKQVIHIPECIANGQYLLRPEMIALHGARTAGGAQLYVSLSWPSADIILIKPSDGMCSDRGHWWNWSEDAPDL